MKTHDIYLVQRSLELKKLILRYSEETLGWAELMTMTDDYKLQEKISEQLSALYKKRLALSKRLKGITEENDFEGLKRFLRNCNINSEFV